MKHAVTGAFGYSGRYIAQRLLAAGETVITLTNSPARDAALQGRIRAFPLCFAEPDRLAEALRGVDVLHNTYWVRFNDRHFSHAAAVANTRRLFEAARKAGVRRIVHVSITNPRKGCGLEYFEGKAELEEALAATGIPHSILRPTVLFGREDILINNIAWTLRNFPIFPVFGDGRYRLQPIHVDDLAELAVTEAKASGTRLINAIGPETFSYRGLAEAVAAALGRKARIVPVYPWFGYACGRLIGAWKRDRFVTWEEVLGLSGDYLHVDAPPAGETRLTDWMRENAATLGLHYASELRRRRDRDAAYLDR
jgi:NADH dehydrogenase